MKPVHVRLALAVVVLALLGFGLGGAEIGVRAADGEVLALGQTATIGETAVPWYRSAAQLNQPWGVTGDGASVWIADSAGRRLLRFGSNGRYEDERGRAGLIDGLWGPPARFVADVALRRRPASPPPGAPTPEPDAEGVAEIWYVDAQAHVAVGRDEETGQVRVIGTPDEPGSDDAHLDGPSGIALGDDGRVYVSDTGNHRVLIFDEGQTPLGKIGTGAPGLGDDALSSPARLHFDGREGLLYVADSGNHRVGAWDVSDPAAPRLVRSYGQGGRAGAAADELDGPLGVSVDASFVYVADAGNCRVQVWRTLQATPWDSLGSEDGCAGGDAMALPSDVALDRDGHVYVADPGSMRVHQFLPDRAFLRFFGSLDLPYLTDDEHLNEPAGVAHAPDGSTYLVERAGMRLQRRDADGNLLWSLGAPGLAGTDEDRLDGPSDVAVDRDGRAVVVERGARRIKLVDPDGTPAWTFGGPGSGDGQLLDPRGVGVAPDGRIAVADAARGDVQIFDPAGVFQDRLGAAGGGPESFDEPSDVAFDGDGRLYVADAGNDRVQVFDASLRFERSVGTGAAGDALDALDGPRRLALDADGRLYVADTGNERVQVFDAEGLHLATIGGRAGRGAGALFEPLGLSVGPEGELAVADSANHRLELFQPAAEPWLPAAESGFGERDIQAIAALADFRGDLYAGTWAPAPRDGGPGLGAALQRRSGAGPDQGRWTELWSGGFGDPERTAVSALRVEDEQLYAGLTSWRETEEGDGRVTRESRGAAILRSPDGESWEPVLEGGLGDPRNAGVTAIRRFGGRLFAGTLSLTDTHPVQLWRSAGGTAGSWAPVMDDGFGDLGNAAIGAMAVMSDTLFVATCHRTGQGQVWRSADGELYTPAGAGGAGLGSGRRQCVSALAPFQDRLYAVTGGDARLGLRGAPAEVWRCAACDGTDWELMAAAGLGDTDNRGRAALMDYVAHPFHFLYLAVGNEEGLQVWRSTDGERWEQAAVGGFGDVFTDDVFGADAFALHEGRLHLGASNDAHGAELWSTAGSRPSGLPPTPGPRPTATPRPPSEPPTGRARYVLNDQWPPGLVIPPDVLGEVSEMAIAADGSSYLLDTSSQRIMRLLPDGSWAPAFGNIGRGPDRIGQAGALALDDARDRVYVADHASERLLLYDLEGGFLEAWPEIYASGIEVRADGRLWVADRMSGALLLLAPDGREEARFGSFGDRDEDQFRGLQDVAEDPDGNLFVADLGGDRVRGFRPEGPSFRRFRTLDLTADRFMGCDGTRITALGPERLLAEGCIIQDAQREDVLPPNHRGSDLYGVQIRSANVAAGHYHALATYDTDRDDPENETWPVVVRYTDEGYDVVARYWRGRALDAATAAADGAIGAPLRLSTAPDGSLVVTDELGGLRLRAPDGRILEELALIPYPSRRNPLFLEPALAVALGRPGEVIGVGEQRGRLSVLYGRTEMQRYCRNRRCEVNPYLTLEWETTLPQLTEGVAAVAHEPTVDQLIVLARRHTSPPTRGIESIEQLLYVYGVGQYGRREEWPLQGEDRDAIWADVDAGRDGRVLVLDTLNDRVQVFGPDGTDRGMVATPKDAWRVAAGPNAEIYVLTVYGHVVRMAADGTVLSRFVGRPHEGVPPTSLVDLAVDDAGWVYTLDELANQVTVFAPQGLEDDVLEGAACRLEGDKWAAPTDLLLGDEVEIFLNLFGTCGFVEEPADIVLAVNTLGRTLGNDWGRQLANNLRRARQIMALTDLDRHRMGIVSFAISGVVEAELTDQPYQLVRGMWTVNAGQGQPQRNYAALRTAMEVLEPSEGSGRQRVIVIVTPADEDDDNTIAYAEELKADGVLIVVVNGDSVVASSDLFNDIDVEPRGMGAGKEVHRRMVSRVWPEHLVEGGTLVDTLPSNMRYVPGSAQPPATWDAASRTLTWQLTDLALSIHRFRLRVEPQEEGEWPTNVEAVAEVTDGWGQPNRVEYPIPRVRVYGEPPTPTPTVTPSPTRTPTPEPTPTARPTGIPVPVFLPLALKTRECDPESKHADVVLALDASGSMSEATSPGGPPKIDAAKDAARAFLAQLQPGRDQSALVQFNSEATTLQALTDDPAVTIAALDAIEQSPGTRIDLALDAGRAQLTGPDVDPSNNPVLILLTDGEPTGTTPEEVRAAATRCHEAGLLVFTIGLGADVPEDLLRDVASQPDWYYHAPDTSDLEAIYEQIVTEIPCRPEWP